MSHLEAFATGIKIESSDQSLLGGRSRDQGGLWIAKNQQSRTHDCNVTFDPWKSHNQESQKGTIKRSSILFKPWSWSQTLLQEICKWLPLVWLPVPGAIYGLVNWKWCIEWWNMWMQRKMKWHSIDEALNNVTTLNLKFSWVQRSSNFLEARI